MLVESMTGGWHACLCQQHLDGHQEGDCHMSHVLTADEGGQVGARAGSAVL